MNLDLTLEKWLLDYMITLQVQEHLWDYMQRVYASLDRSWPPADRPYDAYAQLRQMRNYRWN